MNKQYRREILFSCTILLCGPQLKCFFSKIINSDDSQIVGVAGNIVHWEGPLATDKQADNAFVVTLTIPADIGKWLMTFSWVTSTCNILTLLLLPVQ